MPDVLYYLLLAAVFLGMISLLVAAHELGHYIVARWCGMGVEEFSVGMFGKKPLATLGRHRYRVPLDPDSDAVEGEMVDVSSAGHGIEGGGAPRMGRVVRGADGRLLTEEETVFNLRPWPIGGFVRIKGMAPREDGSEITVPGGFFSKPAWQRLLVLAAGPFASVVTGVAVLAGLYGSQPIARPSLEPIIGLVAPASPAEKGGLKTGDRVTSVAGQPVTDFHSIVVAVRDRKAEPFALGVVRGGVTLMLTVTPEISAEKTPVLDEHFEPTAEYRRQAKLGVAPTIVKVRMGYGEALSTAARRPPTIVANLVGIVKRPSEAKDKVGGTVAMVRQTEMALKYGPSAVVEIAGLFSISVGIFNLLPIFPLDGGQMVVAVVEMLRRGRRLSLATQNLISLAGFAILLLLIVTVNVLDVAKLVGRA